MRERYSAFMKKDKWRGKEKEMINRDEREMGKRSDGVEKKK